MPSESTCAPKTHRREAVRQPEIAVRGHGAALLVVTANVREVRAPADCIVEVHRAAAGDEKDMPDPVLRQHLGDVVGETHHAPPFERK
jgi:hypothetical protein